LPNCLLPPKPPAGGNMTRIIPSATVIAMRTTPITDNRYGYFICQVSSKNLHLKVAFSSMEK
jgi:hypothetical protein